MLVNTNNPDGQTDCQISGQVYQADRQNVLDVLERYKVVGLNWIHILDL